ncbi:extended synaptotagmin-3 [Tachysurus fulvidraco]|uniref:extended synaptotagmin-3 n=1 Tax=Tachysurus fulvidraco TaxID=1234273 RepID=UPI000F4FDDE2|nr:extended synaptotagmin-3 [Tachysurus fulvidraco]XP_027008332.1 extended synaptotagmin-3 [Tachysurus fulvidraco]
MSSEGAGEEMEKELNSGQVNKALMEFLVFVGRCALLLYPVFVCGALGLSASWLLLTVLLWELWDKNRRRKVQRMDTAIDFVDNECHVIKKEMTKALNSPTWIQFSEVEKAGWINKILLQAWPFFGVFMDKLLKESIQNSIRQSSPHLKTFTFTKVHFGQKAPTITGVRVYTQEADTREVILDFNITYVGDIDIDADVKPRISAGVKELQLQGMLRVILSPLIGQSPLVGGVTMFFIRRPTLHLNWTGMTNLLDSPALKQFSESTIMDIISSMMVLPNRLCFPLIDQVKVDEMRFPLPRGVVRVHVLEGKDLKAMDKVMMGLAKGTSDPYVVLTVGNQRFKTKTIKETLNPRWNEVYEFVIHEAPGQELEVELYDEDTDKDDFMGRFKLDFGEVRNERIIDKWFKLEEIEKGSVHMKMQWLSLQTDTELLKEATDGLACAMLAVYLDSASNLPKDHNELNQLEKHGKQPKDARLTRRQQNPNSYVKLSVDQQSQKSKIVYASRDPVFEQYFTFFVHNVESQVLNVQVFLAEKKNTLGILTLPFSRLLKASEMTLDQPFQLERSGSNSQLKMKAILRILKLEKPKPIVTNPPAAKPQTGNKAKDPRQSLTELNSLKPEEINQASSLSQMQAPGSLSSGPQPEYKARRGSLMVSDNRLSGANQMRRYDSHSLLSENSLASSRLDLLEGVPYPDAILNHQGSFGQIQLTIRYATLRNKLTVTVINCKNLFPCNTYGSDTYVRIYLLPDQKWKNRMRSKVKRKTVDPVFDEKFDFSVTLEEAKSRMLDVSVKNNRMFHTRERKEIGMVLIDLAQLDLVKGSTEWYELSIPGLKKAA